ncbi:hypothetical protein BGZ95_003564 [Linnemannia exigua]|uniref:Uncharacterized protein n=1 Tax=Linnemannia exigua TaxID=604196 RepID=A0AAD4DK38_9FUNG|nr:hypothetical protein BGZ95_003564 [Linnemannia exigua]
MASFSSLNTFTLALIALLLASILANTSIDAAPVVAAAAPPAAPAKPAPAKPAPAKPAPAKPAPAKPDPKVPVFSIYPQDNEKGTAKKVTGFGCHNHGLKAVASVHYRSGPHAQIKFYSGKDCKGKVTHSMPINTYKSMGGPYKSQSVIVFNGKGGPMQ